MLDVSNIPYQSDNVNIFYANSTTAWQTWTKPRKCNFVWMMCIGGAAGGQGGVSGSTITSIALNGGGSGAVTKAIFTANTLPDVLYVQTGLGGAGGIGTTQTSVAGTPGGGNRSFVVINPSGSVPAVLNTVCVSGTTAAAAATGESAATTAVAGLLSLGTFTSIAGVTSTGTPAPLVSNITMPGSTQSGGGTNNAPNSIASVNVGLFSTPTVPPGLSGGGPGVNGIWYWKPMFGIGGTSGGHNASGPGGIGGNGAYGCGGGPGGVGTNAAGGNGGRGGDGLVIIATF
jgi:hypothetical protein